jgi:hypothetical protein
MCVHCQVGVRGLDSDNTRKRLTYLCNVFVGDSLTINNIMCSFFVEFCQLSGPNAISTEEGVEWSTFGIHCLFIAYLYMGIAAALKSHSLNIQNTTPLPLAHSLSHTKNHKMYITFSNT